MHVDAALVAVDGEHHGKAHADFGGGDSNDEEGKDLGRDRGAPYSLRATTMAPMSAASRSTEIASNATM